MQMPGFLLSMRARGKTQGVIPLLEAHHVPSGATRYLYRDIAAFWDIMISVAQEEE